MNLISLFILAFLTENVVLTKFLGTCPLMGTSNKMKSALGMGIAVTMVTVLSSLICFLIYYYILVPSNVTYLKTVTFILVIASLVQIAEIVIKNKMPKLHKEFGIYLPLITTNCMVLGSILLGISNEYNLVEMLVFSFGSSLGFTVILYLFASIRERLEVANVPISLKGFPISLITIGLIAIIFSRLI